MSCYCCADAKRTRFYEEQNKQLLIFLKTIFYYYCNHTAFSVVLRFTLLPSCLLLWTIILFFFHYYIRSTVYREAQCFPLVLTNCKVNEINVLYSCYSYCMYFFSLVSSTIITNKNCTLELLLMSFSITIYYN